MYERRYQAGALAAIMKGWIREKVALRSLKLTKMAVYYIHCYIQKESLYQDGNRVEV